MIDLANRQIKKPISLNIDSQAKAKRVYAEREYVMCRVPLEIPKGFGLLIAKEADQHIIASPDLDMGNRAEEQLFFINLRSIALCNSLGMEFTPVTSLFLMTSLSINDISFDEFSNNMS